MPSDACSPTDVTRAEILVTWRCVVISAGGVLLMRATGVLEWGLRERAERGVGEREPARERESTEHRARRGRIEASKPH